MAKASTAIASDNDWEVEDALRTLTRAEEIKKNPKMMAKVRAMAKDKIKRMQGLGLVAEAQAKKE